MELPNSETDNNDNVFLPEKNKNKEDFEEGKNPLIVTPLQSEKVTIIVKPPILENRESLKFKIEGALESVKENASNIVDKVVKEEEQDINSFKRNTESIWRTSITTGWRTHLNFRLQGLRCLTITIHLTLTAFCCLT